MTFISYSLTTLLLLYVLAVVNVNSFSPSSIQHHHVAPPITPAASITDVRATASPTSSRPRSTTAMYFFGKKAEQGAGAGAGKGTPSPPTINGKAVKAKTGEKVSAVANRAKVKITYSCRKGDCGTCELMMNGLIVKACQAKIPAGKCDMRTF